MFSKKNFLTVFIMLSSFSAFAAGDAGCGLGSMIISRNSKVLQLLAMTTNSYFLTQPLGITIGTSGCSASGIVNKEKELQYFVEVNQEELSRQIAEGQGEKLNTLAAILGCEGTQGQNQFANTVQLNYSNIVTKSDLKSTEMVENLSSVLLNNSKTISECRGS